MNDSCPIFYSDGAGADPETPNILYGQQLQKTLHQENPDYYNKTLDRRNKCRGRKCVGGFLADAQKQYDLRLINQEWGAIYSFCLSIALKRYFEEEQISEIYKTISYAIGYFTAKQNNKGEYCYDIHTTKKDLIDWHFTFRTIHDWEALKQHIRKTITKKHKLTGKEFTIQYEPYEDNRWFDYTTRRKTKGWHGEIEVDDYQNQNRVLFPKDVKLRGHGATKGFWVKGLLATKDEYKLRKLQEQDNNNTKYFKNHPDLEERVNEHIKQIIDWQSDDWRTEELPDFNKEKRRFGNLCRGKKFQTGQEFYDFIWKPIEDT